MRQSADDPRETGNASFTLSGSAQDVVQARDISGGVHFHATPRPGSTVSVPHQLPADVRGFIGRAAELERLETFLADGDGPGTLVVVAGTAGVGKTSLAVHFAHRALARFPDGQLFVNLRGYDPGEPLAPTAALERFLRALGAPPAAIPAALEERAALYRTLLSERRMLVVLDNAATVGQVRPLLPGGAGCLVVVTSRSRLSGLSARDGARRVALSLLTKSESVALVRTVIGEYRTGDDTEQVELLARLCARLPLALRIAAERAAARPLMPLRELIEDLRGESSLWDALSSEDEADADAVRTVFAWSYRALPPAAARTFRMLGLHPGPDFGPGAAAALLGESANRVRALLDVLAGAYLLEQTAVARYQFHDLLRAYAADLAASQEEDEAQRAALLRVAHWYLYTADSAMRATQTLRPSVLTGVPVAGCSPLTLDDQESANAWFLAERANLLALAHTASDAQLDDVTWQLSASLQTLQGAHGAGDDRLTMGRLGLAAARRLGDSNAQAKMSQVLGFGYKAAGRLDRAAEEHRHALELYTARDDVLGVVEATNSIGLIHLRRREFDAAASCFQTATRLAEEQEQRTWHAVVLDNLARTRLSMGMVAQAIDAAEAAVCAHEEIVTQGATRVEALITLIRALRESGHPDRAEVHIRRAEEIFAGGMHFLALEIDVLLERAAIMSSRGDIGGASETCLKCLQLLRKLSDPGREAATYTAIGRILREQGRTDEAIEFHRRAAATLRGHHDAFQLAVTFSSLAELLDIAGLQDEARTCRAEANDLLSQFDDPRVTNLRAQLARHT